MEGLPKPEGLPKAAEVFISEDIPHGNKWREQIRKELATSDFLILLYTNPDANWNWCFYEAGLFEDLRREYVEANEPGGHGPEHDRFVTTCLMSPHAFGVPGPIENLQTTVADPKDVAPVHSLLDRIFVREDPIRKIWAYPSAGQRPLEEMAKQIADAVGRAQVGSRYLEKTAVVHIPARYCGQKEKGSAAGRKRVRSAQNTPSAMLAASEQDANVPVRRSILEGALVRSPDGGTSFETLFDRDGDGKPLPWAQLDASEWFQSKWVDDFQKSLEDVEQRRIPSALLAPHQLKPNGSIYDPVLYRIERFASGAMDCHILFSDRKGRSAPITSFTELIRELTGLVSSTREGDRIRFLAYTPALGFLAQPQSDWEQLKQAICAKLGQIELVCLASSDLHTWHARFERKPTQRPERIITAELIRRANDASRELCDAILEADGKVVEMRWSEMPEFYLFSNGQRAIYVVPFGLPRLDRDGAHDRDERRLSVEMFGVTSHITGVAEKARKLHEQISQGQPQGARSGNRNGSAPDSPPHAAQAE